MTPREEQVFADVGNALENCTQKEKLQVATWIVLSCLNEPQQGMTQADSYLDVITRHCGDCGNQFFVLTQARGRLARYGNDGFPKR